jgi:hypothetical protein
MLAKLQIFKIQTHSFFITKVHVTQLVRTHRKARVVINFIQNKWV